MTKQVKENSCEIKNCRKEDSIKYYGHFICMDHWEKHCKNEINLKKEFGIKD